MLAIIRTSVSSDSRSRGSGSRSSVVKGIADPYPNRNWCRPVVLVHRYLVAPVSVDQNIRNELSILQLGLARKDLIFREIQSSKFQLIKNGTKRRHVERSGGDLKNNR